jgi:hypothetical protein
VKLEEPSLIEIIKALELALGEDREGQNLLSVQLLGGSLEKLFGNVSGKTACRQIVMKIKDPDDPQKLFNLVSVAREINSVTALESVYAQYLKFMESRLPVAHAAAELLVEQAHHFHRSAATVPVAGLVTWLTEVSKAVCRIESGSMIASGFVAGPSQIVTCRHVFRDIARASQRATARFASGREIPFIASIDMLARGTAVHPNLDVARVTTEQTIADYPLADAKVARNSTGQPWIVLELDAPILEDQNISIVHFRGADIVLERGRVLKTSAMTVHHVASTEAGTSGAPGFGDDGKCKFIHALIDMNMNSGVGIPTYAMRDWWRAT